MRSTLDLMCKYMLFCVDVELSHTVDRVKTILCVISNNINTTDLLISAREDRCVFVLAF